MNNETINDKRTTFLDMQEHPERYTDEQIEELLADEDIREFAHTLALSKRAIVSREPAEIDVDAAWEQFAGTHIPARRNRLKIAAAVVGVVLVSGMAWAAAMQWGIFRWEERPAGPSTAPHTEQTIAADTLHRDTTALPKDSMSMAPVTFDNAELGTILKQMGTFYHVEVTFRREPTRHIRLYFKWDKHVDLQQQIDLLNGFDRINITLENGNLNVE